jgi:hypothetical protein
MSFPILDFARLEAACTAIDPHHRIVHEAALPRRRMAWGCSSRPLMQDSRVSPISDAPVSSASEVPNIF